MLLVLCVAFCIVHRFTFFFIPEKKKKIETKTPATIECIVKSLLLSFLGVNRVNNYFVNVFIICTPRIEEENSNFIGRL